MRKRVAALVVLAGAATALVLAAAAAAHHPGQGGKRFVVQLRPEEECNTLGVCNLGQPGASGQSVLRLNPGQGEVCFETTASGLTAPVIGAHIHEAPAGIAGPIVVPLNPPVGSGCVSADRQLIKEIMKEPADYYVNVHTTTHPGGAIRGQLG